MIKKHDAVNVQGHNNIDGHFVKIAKEQTLCIF